MAYKRQISYFDLMENELKRGNAGFVKWEKYDECHILSVFVSGLAETYSKEATVYLESQPVGRLNIRNGRADGTYLLTKGEKNWTKTIGTIRIPLEKGTELAAHFENKAFGVTGDDNPKETGAASQAELKEQEASGTAIQEESKKQEAPEASIQKELEKQESPGTAIQEEPKKQESPETAIQEEQKKQEASGTTIQEEPKEQEASGASIRGDSKGLLRQTDSAKHNSNEPQPDLIQKNLWERLREKNELIYPFGNDVGCYRIFPKDIDMLQANYQQLKNNQFLLHGYYNYRYLILCKKENSENEFWLGVPGIYHEREKMAARMFGFEKFEGAKTNYRVGDLGYYLITVE